MQKIDFEEAVDLCLSRDQRFERAAYRFVRDALDFTLKRLRPEDKEEWIDKHVTGTELSIGIRDFALREFGPMVPTVFQEWGIKDCGDFGHIVFNLIAARVFGKTEQDQPEDFAGHYDFHETFVKPFLPEQGAGHPTGQGRATC